MRDRRGGFVYQTLSALNALRVRFDGRREEDGSKLSLNTALGIYTVLTELANAERGDDFQASIAKIGTMAGSTGPTVRKYLPVFIEIGLLDLERVAGPHGDEPSKYALVEGVKSVDGGGKPVDPPVESDLLPEGGKSLSTVLRKEEDASSTCGSQPEIPEEMLLDANALLNAKTKVDGRMVSPAEMQRATAALAEFNRQLGSSYGIGTNLTPLVMRIRERPSWEPDKYVRLVQSAFRIKWWEAAGRSKRRPTPAVIFGNPRVFEAVTEDAASEARGEATENVKARRFVKKGRTEKQTDA